MPRDINLEVDNENREEQRGAFRFLQAQPRGYLSSLASLGEQV